METNETNIPDILRSILSDSSHSSSFVQFAHEEDPFHGSGMPSSHGALIKKPLGCTAFVKDLSMAKINMPMDNQV